MARRWIFSGSKYEDMAGYSRAVVDGDWIFVSGTVGYDFATDTIADDAAEQARQAIRTIEKAITEAGGSLADVVRVRVFLADRADLGPIAQVIKEAFGAHRPANTTVICQLAAPEMKVEIEVTALRRREA